MRGFYRGGEVFFIHTEASDADVAGMLTMMMGPQVVHVPDLADVPRSASAGVYVFKSGIPGDGPFGFQPDVFDSGPGDRGYSPLRAVSLVTWNEGAFPPSGIPGEKLQVKIGGMQCSFCVESIKSAFHRIDGVSEVSVSLAHEEALVQYDPDVARPEKFRETLVAMG